MRPKPLIPTLMVAMAMWMGDVVCDLVVWCGVVWSLRVSLLRGGLTCKGAKQESENQ
jgi:hypothetical protein